MYIDFTLKVDEEFVRKNQDQFDWQNWADICEHVKMSEDFIREFQNKVNWEEISCHQKLSENFIREFQNKVCWFWISFFQNLSNKFIIEFKNYIDFEKILEKYGYSISVISKFKVNKDNFHSNELNYLELRDLALKLISLKAFQ